MQKKHIFLISVMLMWMMVLAVGKEKKSNKTSTESPAETVCVTQVPTEGTVGVPVQFRVQFEDAYNPGDSGDIYSIDYIGETPVRMRYVKTGSFLQGSSPVDDISRNGDEEQFTHTLTRYLAVMETEVSIKMWTELKTFQSTLPDIPPMGDSPGINHPVHNVTWQECILFANLLSLQNGLTPCYTYTKDSETHVINSEADFIFNFSDKPISCDFDANGYRLPTEGEWEFFCRAGTQSYFHIYISKSDYEASYQTCNPGALPALESVARFCANSNGTTQPIGSREGNNWNIKDTHGSVREWCWDGYKYDYPPNSATDYTGLYNATLRVLRNGGWTQEIKPHLLRCASRFYKTYTGRSTENGFRLVRTVPPVQ